MSQPPNNWTSTQNISPTDTINSPINAYPQFSEFTPSTYASVPSDSTWNMDSYFKQQPGVILSFASPTANYSNSFMSAPLEMDDDEDDNSDTTDKTFLEQKVSIPSPQITTESSHSHQRPRKESWEEMSIAAEIQSSSKKHSTRSKTQQNNQSGSRSNSSLNSTAGPQLRNVRHRPNLEVEAQTPGRMPGSRASHNMVERNYRTRLNNQFSHLLEVLPADMVAVEIGAGSMSSGDQEKKVSKGEILLLARRYILNLEEAKRILEAEKVEMEKDIRRLRAALIKKGGGALNMISFEGMK